MGEVEDSFGLEKDTMNVAYNGTLTTQFEIEKYWGDVTEDISNLTPITETIPIGPDTNPDYRVRFRISSNHPEEYVHLETCELSEELENGNIINTATFIEDGCVQEDFKKFIFNTDRKIFANEDVFNMRPFLFGCKTKWHVKCKTASCQRDLETKSKTAFDEYCSIPASKSSTCNRKYYPEFLKQTGRRRRSTEDSYVEEAIVEAVLQHPCYYVNALNPAHCSDGICWNLSECAGAFPDDFPDFIPTDENGKLNRIIGLLKDLFTEHINEDADNDAEMMANEIENQANLVLRSVQTVEQGLEKLKEIATKND